MNPECSPYVKSDPGNRLPSELLDGKLSQRFDSGSDPMKLHTSNISSASKRLSPEKKIPKKDEQTKCDHLNIPDEPRPDSREVND